MPNDITCPNCQISFTTDFNDLQVINSAGIGATCPVCGYNVLVASLTENIVNQHVSEVLKIGDVVQITNTEHVWCNEFAVICDVKPLFYRIEVMGRKMWVPQHWVKINEPNDTN